MSREIKFRFWTKKGNAIVPWELAKRECDRLSLLELDDFIPMQFTGLYDKNGVEIYEGDILNVCNGSLNGVEWMEKPYAVEYVLNKGFNICMFCWMSDGQNRMDSTHWCEVIGNIYENPELLETK